MNRMWIASLAVFAAIAVLMFSAVVAPTQATTGVAATVSGASTDAQALSSGVTAGACAQAKIPLGAAANFRVLAGTTVTNTGATTINGNLGVSPGSAVTGFPPGIVTGTIHKADTKAANAQLDLTKAYKNGMGRSHCATTVSGNIGGRTLGPGLYTASSSLAISSGDLTLTAHGHSGAVFIFQITTKFTTTTGRKVILAGGALDSNIYWVVGSSATLGTFSVLHGTIIAHKSISLATSAKLHGRALAHIGAVTFAGNVVSNTPAPPMPHSVVVSPSMMARSFA
jgi:hypothetical protein